MFNMGVQLALPDPATTQGTFTLNVPLNCVDFSPIVIADKVFVNVHIQQNSSIPASPPTTPLVYQYRALNTSWRDDTATQFNIFIAFVPLSTQTYILAQVVAIV